VIVDGAQPTQPRGCSLKKREVVVECQVAVGVMRRQAGWRRKGLSPSAVGRRKNGRGISLGRGIGGGDQTFMHRKHEVRGPSRAKP